MFDFVQINFFVFPSANAPKTNSMICFSTLELSELYLKKGNFSF